MLNSALEVELHACCEKISTVSAELAELASEIDAAPRHPDAMCNDVLGAAVELREAFAFIDELVSCVEDAALLVEATGRRLDALERGERLPTSLANLPPAQFSAHQFTRQLRRRERGPVPKLPELTALPPSRWEPGHDSGGQAGDRMPESPADLAELERIARTAAAHAADGARTLFRRLQDMKLSMPSR
jgi:hypothetical protein